MGVRHRRPSGEPIIPERRGLASNLLRRRHMKAISIDELNDTIAEVWDIAEADRTGDPLSVPPCDLVVEHGENGFVVLSE